MPGTKEPTLKSIIFSTPLVLKILAGAKTQTRRVINPQPTISPNGAICDRFWQSKPFGGLIMPLAADLVMYSPYKSGDLLYVKETFLPCKGSSGKSSIADASYVCFRDASQTFRTGKIYTETPPRLDASWPSWAKSHWKSSRFMPRWAARCWLRVEHVHVERLHDITILDANAEGFRGDAVHDFVKTWRTLHKKAPERVEDNPWVWVIRFRRISKP